MEKTINKKRYLRTFLVAGALASGISSTSINISAQQIAQSNVINNQSVMANNTTEQEYYNKSIESYHKTILYRKVESIERSYREYFNLSKKAQLQEIIGKGFLFYLINKARMDAGLGTVGNLNLSSTEQHAIYVGLSRTPTTSDGLAMTPNMRNNVYGGHEYVKEVADYIGYKEKIPSSKQTEEYVASIMYKWLNTPKYRARILDPLANDVSISLWIDYAYNARASKGKEPYDMSVVLDSVVNQINWMYNSPVIFSNGNIILSGKTTPEILRSINHITVKYYPTLSFKNSYSPKIISNDLDILDVQQYGITAQNGLINVNPQIPAMNMLPMHAVISSAANNEQSTGVLFLFGLPPGNLIKEGYKVVKTGPLPTAPSNVHLPTWIPKTMNGTEYEIHSNGSNLSNQLQPNVNRSDYNIVNPSVYQTSLNYNTGEFKMCFNINSIIRIPGSMQGRPGEYELLLKNNGNSTLSAITVFVNNNGPYNISYKQIPINFWMRRIRR